MHLAAPHLKKKALQRASARSREEGFSALKRKALQRAQEKSA